MDERYGDATGPASDLKARYILPVFTGREHGCHFGHPCCKYKIIVTSLRFARVVDDAKCIVVKRVCVSVRGRMPTLLHGPGCNLGEW